MRAILFVLLVSGLLFASSVQGDENVFIPTFVSHNKGDTWTGDGGETWSLADEPKWSLKAKDTSDNIRADDVTDMKGEFLWMLNSLVRELETKTNPIKPLSGKYGLDACFNVSPTGEVALCDPPKH